MPTRKIINVLLSALLLITSLYTFGWCEGDGTSGATFLKIPVGTRATSMGGAFVSVSDDVSAIHWNPAGLATQNSREFMAVYQKLYQDTSFSVISYAQPVDISGNTIVFGGSFLSSKVDNIKETDESGPTGSELDFSDFSFTGSAAYNYDDVLLLGSNLKYIKETLAEYDKDSFALDIGAIYRPGLRNVTIGLVLANIGPGFKGDRQIGGVDLGDGIIVGGNKLEEDLPFLIQGGISDTYAFGSNVLRLALEGSKYNDSDAKVHFGGEFWIYDVFAIRAGYVSQDEGGINIGLGYRQFGASNYNDSVYEFGYSYSDAGDLGSSQTISLIAKF
jgi:Uncharacterised protein family (UPF0164)